MDSPCLVYVPQVLQKDAQRLMDISPLFVSLMRDEDAQTCLSVFQHKKKTVLPDTGQVGFPSCVSHELAECLQHLRLLKQQALRHILWWELGIHGDIESSYHAISDVASALLQQALLMAERLVMPRFGQLEHGSFCVIGLGKLGGRELNLGSDVDLLFVWQGEGLTQGGRKAVPANEYYNHLSRMLIRLMSEHTSDGLVWPMDMRLRPGGDGAAICLNLEATLSHYLDYGQTWERAMLVKARPIAGDMNLGATFVDGVCPFVYRRYLDYSSVSALADMKRRIDAQAGHAEIGQDFDVKRGHGGIREIEFLIQSMQLLHGGRDAYLRSSEGKIALAQLQAKDHILHDEATKLFEAYCFWRRVEHALQARKGEQTHALPADYELYLAQALGLEDVKAKMQMHSDDVAKIFAKRVLPLPESETHEPNWLVGSHPLTAFGLSDEDQLRIQAALQHMDEQLLRGLLPERSRKQIELILQQAMPCWLKDANGVSAVESFADLLHSIAGRATWIDLLATHQGALDWLIGVLSASRYLAEHIVKKPTWLEWPLAEERGAVEIERICDVISKLKIDDEAQFLNELGRLVDQARVQCALLIDAHKADPLMIGVMLAHVADDAIQACLSSSLQQLKLPEDFPLVALALGKHGSQEMGLVSDLDMVFVLAEDPNLEINGRSAREWAQRLGRRMIRQVTGQYPFGAGYEFDARLRPSGHSGVLVTTLEGFQSYQLHEAHTWEHQALCRARAVTGTKQARKRVMDIVQVVLGQKRNFTALAADVLLMRKKMLDHLASKRNGFLSLKHDKGGLVDIEFLAQFSRLMFGGNHTGTVETFRCLPESAPQLWQQHAAYLAETYLNYRQMENALRVELWESIGALPEDIHAKEWVTLQRHALITSPQALKDTMALVHVIFRNLLVIKVLH